MTRSCLDLILFDEFDLTAAVLRASSEPIYLLDDLHIRVFRALVLTFLLLGLLFSDDDELGVVCAEDKAVVVDHINVFAIRVLDDKLPLVDIVKTHFVGAVERTMGFV